MSHAVVITYQESNLEKQFICSHEHTSVCLRQRLQITHLEFMEIQTERSVKQKCINETDRHTHG